MRGFSVFLDVTDLSSGRCYDRLVETIFASRHFLLVLTGGSLDGVIGDEDRRDWVHREIHAATRADCNIIPIADSYFTWPSSIDSLPNDIKYITSLNTIKWLHDYQDACVDKIEKFILDLGKSSDGKLKVISSGSNPASTASAKSPPQQQQQPQRIASTVPNDFLKGSLSAVGGPHNPPNPIRNVTKTK